MAREDVAAGTMKQARGKANDIVGAAKGDSSQQMKGKMHRRPHAPQLLLSLERSRHDPPQLVLPAPHRPTPRPPR